MKFREHRQRKKYEEIGKIGSNSLRIGILIEFYSPSAFAIKQNVWYKNSARVLVVYRSRYQ